MALDRHKVQAGFNAIYKEQEVSPIYMISELIDNSKSSYEQIIESEGYASRDLPIRIIVDEKNSCLIVEDEGSGFNIFEAISQVGSDEPKLNSTNQYYLGLKNAMIFFTWFSIIISEYKDENGNYVRCANQFIRGEGCLTKDVSLKTKAKTGSQVIMFIDYESAKQFWEKLDFLDSLHANDFPNEVLVNDKKVSRIHHILQEPREWISFIMNYLTVRYRPLVNKYSDIFIESYINEKNGSLKKFELVNNTDSVQGIYNNISTVKQMSFTEKLSFDFSKFFDSAFKFRRFMERYSENDIAIKVIEKVLLEDIKAYFKKVKNTYKDNKQISWNKVSSALKWGPKINSHLNNSEFEFSENLNEEWEELPFPSVIAKVFLSMIKKKSGKFDFIDFTINNLIISDDRIIINSKSDPSNFSVDIKMSIKSERFSEYGVSKSISNTYSGFEIIQNNRCIFHSCLSSNYSNFSGDNSSHKQPEFFMSKCLRYADTNNIPFVKYSESKRKSENRLTIPLFGGNVEKPSRLIIGSVKIENDINFASKSNKLEFENKELLENYLKEILTKSAISVFANWIHQFQNTYKPKDKKNPGEISWFFESELQKMQNPDNQEIDDLEENISETIDIAIKKELEEQMPPKLLSNSQESVVRYVESAFRKEKNNNFQDNKINSVKKEGEKEIHITTNIKSMQKWGNKIIVSIDTESESEELKIHENIGENVTIIYPLSEKETSLEDKKKTLNIIVKRIHSLLSNAKGYYEIRKFLNKKLKEQEINHEMYDYFSTKFRSLKEDVNRELNRNSENQVDYESE